MNRHGAIRAVAAVAGIAVAVASGSAPARATFIVDFSQVGANVVAIGHGSINKADLVVNSGGGIAPFVAPLFPTVILGPPNIFPPITIYTVAAATGLPPIGPGNETFVSSGSGDEVGFQSHIIVLPQNYVSQAPLADMSVWNDASFASLGLTPGSYSETFGTGANADMLQINVRAVPEPATAVLFATALGCLGALRVFSIRPRRNAIGQRGAMATCEDT